MTTENTQGTEGNEPSGAPQLSPEEQASVEVGRRGLSEVSDPNQLPPEGPQRPDYIPEKFWKDGQADLEGLAKSYAALESKLGSGQPAEEAPAASEEAPADPNGKLTKPEGAPEGEPAETPLSKAMASAAEEFSTTQAFSEDTQKALVEAGIPVEIQNIYLEGLKAVAERDVATIHSYVGGEAAYTEMANWARQHLTDAEMDAYNAALDNPSLRETAVRGLHAKFSAARPSEGNLVSPSGGAAAAGDVYQSRDEMLKDMRDPRYASDASFRQQVTEKLARSQSGGFQLTKRPMFERTIISS